MWNEKQASLLYSRVLTLNSSRYEHVTALSPTLSLQMPQQETVDLAGLPPTQLLPTNLTPAEAAQLRDQLRACNCPLVEARQARLFLVANVNTRKRCELELRRAGLAISPSPPPPPPPVPGEIEGKTEEKIAERTAEKTAETEGWAVRVVKLDWLTASLARGSAAALDEYTILRGIAASLSPRSPPPQHDGDKRERKAVMERALADARARELTERPVAKRRRRDEPPAETQDLDAIVAISKKPPRRRPLLRRSTSSFEADKLSAAVDMPEWVRTKVARLPRSLPLPHRPATDARRHRTSIHAVARRRSQVPTTRSSPSSE